MADFNLEEEAFIQRFVGLQTADEKAPAIKLPTSAASSTDWERSVLIKVVTDKPVNEVVLADTLRRAWNADMDTVFRPVARNLFLVEFSNLADLYTCTVGGIWTFRGDLVAPRRVTSQLDLHEGHIVFANLWVQFFNIPLNSLTDEGIDILAQKIGTPVSPPVEGFIGGRRFTKVRVMVHLNKPLLDTVPLDHPTLGEIPIHCHYEKVSRICNFCGKLGHEFAGCIDHQRLAEALRHPSRAGKYDAEQLLKPKKGKWMTEPGQIPRVATGPKKTGQKRPPAQDPINGAQVNSSTGPTNLSMPNDLGPSSPILSLRQGNTPIKRPRPAGLNPPDCVL